MALGFNGNSANYVYEDVAFGADRGTLMGWCKVTTDLNDYSTFFQTNNTDNAQFVVQTNATGTVLSCYIFDSNGSGTDMTPGTWYHIALTWDGTSARVYVNGTLDITVTATGSDWNQIQLGRSFWLEPLNGAIAHVKAWDAVLTQTEIAAEKDHIFRVRETNLIGVWPTVPGANRLVDISGNANHLNSSGTISDVDNPLRPTISAYTTTARSSNGTTITGAVPTNVYGDAIYYAYVSDGDGDIATISGTGWTPIYSQFPAPSTGVPWSGSFYLWRRVSAGTEPADYTVTNSVSERAVLVAFTVQNDGGLDVRAPSTTGTGTNITASAITSGQANTLRVSLVASSGDRVPITTFSGHTVTTTFSSVSGGTISLQYKPLAAAGADAEVYADQTTSGWTCHVFTIAPTGGVPITWRSVPETGAGSEAFGISSTRSITDTGAGSESVTAGEPAITKPIQDQGIGTEGLRILKSPYLVNVASSTSGPGVTSRTVSVPAGTQDGDIMLAVCVIELASGAVTAHANWGTEILNTPLSTRTHTQVVYARKANSEPADYTFSWSSCECAAAILTFRGGILPTQYQAQVNNTAVTSVTAPDLTTTMDDSMVVWLGSIMYGATFTPPANYDEVLDIRTSTASTNMGVSVATRVLKTAGATGASAGTASNADYNVGAHIIIPPAFLNIVLPSKGVGTETVSYTEGGGSASKSVTDAGAGADGAPSLAVSFGLAETMSGTDSFAGAAALVQAVESFLGADGITNLSNQFLTTDSATFTDLVTQLTSYLLASDAVTASDAITALIASAVVSDQGTTSEGAVAAVAVTLGDILTGSDAVNIITSTLISLLESGSFSDLLSITVSPLQVVDVSAGSEALAISTISVVMDTGLGASSLLLSVSSLIEDTGSGTDGTQVVVQVIVPENASGSELISLVLDTIKQILEVAHGVEQINLVSAQALVTDGATGLDVTSAVVTLNLSDSGSLSDMLLLSCLVALSDVASSSENIGLQVQLQVSDLGQAMVILSGMTNLFQVGDLASAVDVSYAYNSATRVVTIGFTMRSRSMSFTARQRSMAFGLKSRAITFLLQGELSDE